MQKEVLRKHLGVELKNGASKWNLYSIPYSFALNILFTNFIAIAGIILLKDKTLFDVPEEKIGQFSTDLFFYPLPLTMVATLFMGYVYDQRG